MLGTKELDLINRSEMSHSLFMTLWDLSSMKGSHNDPFVVTKKTILQYLTDLKEDYETADAAYIESTSDVKGLLETIVEKMKTNNLYIQ